MNSDRARRVLLVAVALSLLVHLVVALVVNWPGNARRNDVEVVSIEHRTTFTHRNRPTPAPRPRVTPEPRASPTHSRRARPPATQPRGVGVAPKPTPAPTPEPSPIATAPAAACAQPNAPAGVLVSPSPADIAPAVRAAGTSGTTVVRVQLDAHGAIVSTSVGQSTGNGSLDLVALAMARSARYAAAVHDCKPVAGSYAFSVKFVAW